MAWPGLSFDSPVLWAGPRLEGIFDGFTVGGRTVGWVTEGVVTSVNYWADPILSILSTTLDSVILQRHS